MRAITALLVLAGAIVIALAGLGQTRVLQSSAILTVVSGDVSVQRVEGAPLQAASDGMLLRTGMTVRTGVDGRAVLTFVEGSTIELEPSTTISIDEVAETGDGAALIRLSQGSGRTWSKVQPMAEARSRFYVRTPSATALVRGTAFEMSASESASLTTISVFEGKLDVVAAGTLMPLSAGRMTSIRTGETATASTQVPAPEVLVRFGLLGSALMTVTAPEGLTAGQTALGTVTQIPRSVVGAPQDEPQLVDVHDPRSGEWEIGLAPWGGGGAFTLVMNTVVANEIRARKVITGTIRPGQHLLTRAFLSAGGVATDLAEPRESTLGRAKIAIDHPTVTARRLDLPRTTPTLSELPPAAVSAADRIDRPGLIFLLPPAPVVARPDQPSGTPSAPTAGAPTQSEVPSAPIALGAPTTSPLSSGPVAAVPPPENGTSPVSSGPVAALPPLENGAPPTPPSIAPPPPIDAGPSSASSAGPTAPPAVAAPPPVGPNPPPAISVRVPQTGHPLTAGVPLNMVMTVGSPLSGPLTVTATIGGVPVQVDRTHLINGTLTVKLATPEDLSDGTSIVSICATDGSGDVGCGSLAVNVRHGTDASGKESTAGPKQATTSGPKGEPGTPAEKSHGKRRPRRRQMT